MRAEKMTLGQLGEWYFSLAQKWGDVFPDEKLAQYWVWSKKVAEGDKDRFVSYLRAGALKLLRGSVGGCKLCPLSQHRMAGRPVLDDCAYTNDPFTTFGDPHMPLGATSAEIMMVAEGPGQFEQRTGVPFVTYQILVGSTCAYKCGEFENCYNSNSQMPQQPCKPTSLEKIAKDDPKTVEGIRQQRASATAFPIKTVAGYLDRALHRAGLWREGWNTKQVLLEVTSDKGKPRPGSIYLTNMVKCRSCKPREGGGWEDESPSKENMDTCTPWLEMQIHIIQPKVVVAMGNPAIMGTTGITEPKVLSMRGNMYPGKFSLPVVVEVHPSFIARQRGDDAAEQQEELLTHFVNSLELAKQIASGEVVPPWMQKKAGMIEETEFPSPDEMEFTSTFG